MSGSVVSNPVWAELRRLGDTTTVASLARKLKLNPHSVRKAVWRLERAGLVARDGFARAPKTGRKTLRITMTNEAGLQARAPRIAQDGSLPPPRPMPARQRIWSAIRVLKRFSRAEAEQCSEQTRQSVEGYLNCLQRAGYIRRVRNNNPKTGTPAEYQLLRNTGLKAPVVSQGRRDGIFFKEVTDQNTGAVYAVGPRASRSASANDDEPVSLRRAR